MRLLSLLQRRRYWPGAELADRLGISERTLRRDIDRLRDLGYAVESDRGTHGGYRLGAAAGDTAILLDNDEVTALAAALHHGIDGNSELAEATLGALTKVLAMLRPEQRRHAETLRRNTAPASSPTAAAPRLAHLDTIAAACRDCVRLRFGYTRADGTHKERYVEPYQLVSYGAGWYLVAYDNDRDDWRTFRLDRMSDPVPGRNSFDPRPPPATDLSEFVRFNISEPDPRHQVVIEIDSPAEPIRAEYGNWADIESLPNDRCRLTMESDTFRWPTHIIANLDATSHVQSPPEFRNHLEAVAERIRAAAADMPALNDP